MVQYMMGDVMRKRLKPFGGQVHPVRFAFHTKADLIAEIEEVNAAHLRRRLYGVPLRSVNNMDHPGGKVQDDLTPGPPVHCCDNSLILYRAIPIVHRISGNSSQPALNVY